MKSHYIEIYNFYLKKYRYKESILLVESSILCYLKIFLDVILLFCELSFFLINHIIYTYIFVFQFFF